MEIKLSYREKIRKDNYLLYNSNGIPAEEKHKNKTRLNNLSDLPIYNDYIICFLEF